jgi:hypothetical protein
MPMMTPMTNQNGYHHTTPPMKCPQKANERLGMILTDFDRDVARLVNLLMYTLETPCSDRSDITTMAARVKKAKGESETLTGLAHAVADQALLWGYYDSNPADEQKLIKATSRLLNLLYKEGNK